MNFDLKMQDISRLIDLIREYYQVKSAKKAQEQA